MPHPPKPRGYPSINWQHPLAKGLVAFWPFNEGPGWDRNGELMVRELVDTGVMDGYGSFPVRQHYWDVGPAGDGFRFDDGAGSSDRIFLREGQNLPADHPARFVGRRSYSYVTRLGISAAQADNAPIILIGSTRFATGGHSLTFFNGLSYIYVNGDYSTAGPAFPTDQPDCHYAVVRRQGTGVQDDVFFYINGELLGQATIPGSLVPPAQATQGAIGNDVAVTNGRFRGLITSLSLYNRALSPSDVLALYKDDFAFLRDPSHFVWFMSEAGVPGDKNLAATLAGDSSVQATLTIEPAPSDVNLDATLPADSAVQATVTIEPSAAVDLSSTLAGDSALAGTLTIEPSAAVDLTTTLPGDADLAATLTLEPSATIDLATTLAGESDLQALLTVEVPGDINLIAPLDGESDLAATLTLEPSAAVDLTATLAGESDLQTLVTIEEPGTVNLIVPLDGDSALAATITIQAEAVVALQANVGGDSAMDVTLTIAPSVSVDLVATLAGEANMVVPVTVVAPGDILVGTQLQGEATMQATLSLVVEGLPLVCNPTIESCTPVRTVEGASVSTVS